MKNRNILLRIVKFFVGSMKDIMVGIISGAVSGLIVGFCLWIITDKIELRRQRNLDTIRAGISGTWQFVIKNGDKWFVDIVSISSDTNLNISGVSIRYAEKPQDKELSEFSDENIKRYRVSGAIIKDNIILNGSDDLNNLSYYDLALNVATDDYLVSGTYFQNIADQYGKLCGRKIKGPDKLVRMTNTDSGKVITLKNKTMGDQVERLIKDCSN